MLPTKTTQQIFTRKAFSVEIKNKILKRSKGICEVCRTNTAYEIHHIVPVCDGGKNIISNLSYLCGFCHDNVPGSQPDGYKEEFGIYKSNGGIMFGAIAWAFWTGWHEGNCSPEKDYTACQKKFRELIHLLIKERKGNPIRVSMSMDVFN